MIVRKLRLQRGWSQEQLATLTGLSVRTIQRIEQGQQPGLESLKALAAVFELDVTQLQESEMKGNEGEDRGRVQVARDEREAMKFVEGLRGFYGHLMSYGAGDRGAVCHQLPEQPDYIWAWWPMLGWGLGLASHAINLFQPFKLFGPEWERRQVEKRLGRRL
ncbi:2TM domain-containing protein [Aeromonas caviae]|uniref:2TM domain-containing protein n=1 Tax=Aeromonas caviae TaxID=648 RepID=UPI0004D8602E|nr:2TM domain-containing protein [Aeromonas caviae]KEP91378.1 XRE family transcriptional regulator [Aeromonas caviae]